MTRDIRAGIVPRMKKDLDVVFGQIRQIARAHTVCIEFGAYTLCNSLRDLAKSILGDHFDWITIDQEASDENSSSDALDSVDTTG